MNLRLVSVCIICILCLTKCTNNIPTFTPISDISSDGNGSSHHVIKNRIGTNKRGIIYDRNYKSSLKGSYIGNVYVVQPGDTLFYIAWITNKNFLDLSKKNHIPKPYNLYPGQSIQLSNSVQTGDLKTIVSENDKNRDISKKRSSQKINTEMMNFKSIKKRERELDKSKNSLIATESAATPVRQSLLTTIGRGYTKVSSWSWPVKKGAIIDNFSSEEGGNKGIDITGITGEPIFSTADGHVVYIGNALQGYGNLVIIKHNDDYLSAYAHNDVVLVKEQQEVKSGQKIAKMGSTGTTSVRLHFEIRHKGKSVNPLHYLPNR